jgi:hypothetical protein
MSFRDLNIEMKDSVATDYTCLQENKEVVSVQRELKENMRCEKIIIITGKSFIVLFALFYYVFSIKALTDTNYIEERKICKLSDLWSYLFSSLFANFIFIKIATKITENKLLIILKPNICIGSIKFSYVLWGSILFYRIPCLNEISDTLLYKMSLLQYIFDIISLSVVFLISLYLVYLVNEDNKKTKELAIESIANAMHNSDSKDNNISINI